MSTQPDPPLSEPPVAVGLGLILLGVCLAVTGAGLLWGLGGGLLAGGLLALLTGILLCWQ